MAAMWVEDELCMTAEEIEQREIPRDEIIECARCGQDQYPLEEVDSRDDAACYAETLLVCREGCRFNKERVR